MYKRQWWALKLGSSDGNSGHNCCTLVYTAKHMPTAVCPVLRAPNARGIDRLNQSCFLRSFVFIYIAINATPNDGRICCCWNRPDLAVENLQVACKIPIMGFVCRNVTALTTLADTECRAVTSTGKVRRCGGSRSDIVTYGVFYHNAILYTHE